MRSSKIYSLVLCAMLGGLVLVTGFAQASVCDGVIMGAGRGSSSRAEAVVQDILRQAGINTRPDGPQLQVRDSRFYQLVMSDPGLQLGETYMQEMWDSPNIEEVTSALLKLGRDEGRFKLQAQYLLKAPVATMTAAYRAGVRYLKSVFSNRQNRSRAMEVAEAHYDAGNDLFFHMLDSTMTYTAGIWGEGFNLEDSQNAKYDLLCRKLGIKPGDRVLDVGSGFGGFARFAAKYYGAKVTGVTISVEQLKLAREISAEQAGVEFVFSDYRDLALRFGRESFDHVVSIEMIEAVGYKNLEEYFQSVKSVLKPGGRFAIQAIARYKDSVNSDPWFDKYIFPNGVAPSTNQLDKAAAASFGAPVDRHDMTVDYSKTLKAWNENFNRAWPELRERYGDTFKRMWNYYLLSVDGGFDARSVQLYQTVYVNGPAAYTPVRSIQPLTTLMSMRTSMRQRARIHNLVEHVQAKSNLVEQFVRPRTRGSARLPKEARIAVIGAGPGGLSSANELQKLGYRNVTVFEANESAGGKSNTVEFNGRRHDMGATMGVIGKYDKIIELADQAGQKTIRFPKENNYSLAAGGKSPPRSLIEKLKLPIQALMYILFYNKQAGRDGRGLEIPSEKMTDNWEILIANLGLDEFGAALKRKIVGYGYTSGPQTPAVYPARMIDTNAILGAAFGHLVMWENGTQPIWNALAQKLNVQPNSRVSRIQRDEKGVHLYFADGRPPETFDKLILAIDPKLALQILDARAEEVNVYSQVRHVPYSTFAVRVDGFAQGCAEVGYLEENMSLDRQGRPMAWIKRYADDNVFIFHLFAPQALSDEQIMSNIREDMARLGATGVKLLEARRWPFFPHVDSDSIRLERFFQRALNLQGLNNTVYVNEALGMATMPDMNAVGVNAAQRLASGEYGDN